MQFRSVYTIELERVLNVEKRPLKRREREREREVYWPERQTEMAYYQPDSVLLMLVLLFVIIQQAEKSDSSDDGSRN